jgi:maltooligosyltrehalose trehalohydrolase
MTKYAVLAPVHGAIFLPDGRVRLRLWAPSHEDVFVVFDDGRSLAMTREPDGFFNAVISGQPGLCYAFRLPDGTQVPDPATRQQKDDVHGWSVLVDPSSFAWHDGKWHGRPWREAVIYELHAGILGGFKGVIEKLPGLQALGITAIEIMPVNDFPGLRNWGYDGVLPYAPDRTYGSPDDLRTLIDAAHELQIMVFLDVVYNHFGPDGNYLSLYAPQFFRSDITTPWGPAIDFRRPEVRSFFTDNVMMWLTDYHFDGLRFDAVHAITEQDWVEEMAATVRASFPPDRQIHLILEHHNDASHLEHDVDAQWNDDAHNVLHVLLTGETGGYYADYADHTAQKLLQCLTEGWVYQGEFSAYLNAPRGTSAAHLSPTAHVLFLQNHDQIGNRAYGERLAVLADPAALEAAIALQILCPQIPMLFMGEEDASRSPFLFFTDHNADLAEAVREGRRKEFAGFAEFADPLKRSTIPDPNHPDTFLASVPQPDEVRATSRHILYRTLIALRSQVLVPRLDAARSLGGRVIGPKSVVASWQLGEDCSLSLACNLDRQPVPLPAIRGRLIFSSVGVQQDTLPGFCTAAYLDMTP